MEPEDEIFDIVDKMKSLGMDVGVDVPQVVVCGDQSSGKSSVLERIVDVKLPTKDTLCTRFATEYIMRSASGPRSLAISIIPAQDSSTEEKERLSSFQVPQAHLGMLREIHDAAMQAMGLDDDGDNAETFSNHVLRIQLHGPGVPNLTLVDLPGIFHGRGTRQTSRDVDKVKELVLDYMKRPRTIILAIISAGNELPNQIVTTWIEEIDPTGARTLGVLTKPDLLEESPGKAQEYLKLVQNREIVLKFGWHVLRNRKLKEASLSNEEFKRIETEYLAHGVWAEVPSERKGIDTLMQSLAVLYRNHIMTEALPLARDLEVVLADCAQKIEKLEAEPSCPDTRHRLCEVGDLFSSLVLNAVQGDYSNDFFRNQSVDGPRHAEIRAAVEVSISRFRFDMIHHGHGSKAIVLTDNLSNNPAQDYIKTRAGFLSMIEQRLSRGGPIAGQFDSVVVGDIFYEQTKNWTAIISKLGDGVHEAVRSGLLQIMYFAGGDMMGEMLWDVVLEPGLRTIEADLRNQMAKEVKVYVDKRKVILDRHITSKIPQAMVSELKSLLGERVLHLLQPGGLLNQLTLHDSGGNDVSFRTKIVDHLVDGLAFGRLPSAEVLQCVQHYYRVGGTLIVVLLTNGTDRSSIQDALNKILSRFDITSFEEWIMNKLPSMFDRDYAVTLSAEHVQGLDAEDGKRQADLQVLKNRREALQDALADLNRVGGVGRKRAAVTSTGSVKRTKTS